MSSILTMELGAEFLRAAGIAWLCFLWGVVVLRVVGDTRHGERIGKGLILLAPVVLTMFGQWSVRQYNVALVSNGIRVQEVADNGGRSVERIDTYIGADGARFEWAGVSARSGQPAIRSMLSRATTGDCCCGGNEGCSKGTDGGCQCVWGLPCSCEGGCGGFCTGESIRF